ncbi:MAG TPA: AraC family transcriptional regulator [Chloroflexota bacterium]|nr:AraC family transcriptional regulator [Chloroflexota bacterium]
MTEHPLPDVVHYARPASGYRLAGLTCTAYGSLANRRERGERCTPGSYAVVYIHAGSGWIETAATTRRIAVEAGDLFWLFPGATHMCAPGPAGWSVQWAAFTGSLAHSFELLGWLSRACPAVHPNDPAQVEALFRRLRADFTGDGPLAGALGAALIHRLAVVAHGSRGSTEPDPRSEVQALPRAVALIQQAAPRPLDLHAVADECGIGYSTLRRRFKQMTGQTITDYLLRVRLDRARDLLAHTRMSVAEVADAVGFADPYYFSRVFRLKEGVSPTAFRVREQQER